MGSSHHELTPKQVSDLAEKDLDFVFALMYLGQEKDAGEHVWGKLIKGKYDQQTIRRLYVKTFISLVESVLSTLKADVLREGRGKFSQGELALLEDKAYELSDKGEAAERPYVGQIKKKLKFIFRCYAKGHGLNHAPNYSDDGWRAFQQAVKIRNRITHPKRIEHMNIGDGEQKLISEAHDWFVESYRGLLKAEIANLTSMAGPPRQE